MILKSKRFPIQVTSTTTFYASIHNIIIISNKRRSEATRDIETKEKKHTPLSRIFSHARDSAHSVSPPKLYARVCIEPFQRRRFKLHGPDKVHSHSARARRGRVPSIMPGVTVSVIIFIVLARVIVTAMPPCSDEDAETSAPKQCARCIIEVRKRRR